MDDLGWPAGPIVRYAHLTGPGRAVAAEWLASRYNTGFTVRDLAAWSGRSYGSVHRLLVEAGVTFRPRATYPHREGGTR